MFWIVSLAIVALTLLWHIHAQDRRENLRAAVLDVLGNRPGTTGDDVAWLVEGLLGRRVGVAETYDVLVQLRDEGLAMSEHQRQPDGFGGYALREGLLVVWRLAEKG